MSSFGSGIKSIQQGSGTKDVLKAIVDSVDVTITTVVLAKSEVRAWCAVTCASGTNPMPQIVPVLTTTTNLKLYLASGNYVGTETVTYSWQIIEYY